MDGSQEIQHPHDALFRAAFGEPERAAELLRSAVPAEITAVIDWTSLTRIDVSFVDEALRPSQADLLFSARIAGRPGFLYLLLEHKAEPDRFTSLQLLRYVVRIWEQCRQRDPQAIHLPPVLPFVLHHGNKPWHAPRQLRELIDLEHTPPALVELQPAFTFALDDLGATDEPELHRRTLSVAALLPLLHLQQLRRRAETAALLLAWRHLHLLLQALPGGQQLLHRLVCYVAAVSDDDPKHLRAAYARISKSTEGQFMTTAEQIRREGLLQGKIEVLLQQLRQRFGPLAEPIADRVRAGTATELERWTGRILTAPSLDEVLG